MVKRERKLIEVPKDYTPPVDIDLDSLSSAALRRLVKEVQDGKLKLGGYDRTHNRHNRS